MYVCVYVRGTRECPTLRDPMDGSLPGSSVHGILQARRLEWVAISFSGGIFPAQEWKLLRRPGSPFNFYLHKKIEILHWQEPTTLICVSPPTLLTSLLIIVMTETHVSDLWKAVLPHHRWGLHGSQRRTPTKWPLPTPSSAAPTHPADSRSSTSPGGCSWPSSSAAPAGRHGSGGGHCA